MLNYSEDTNIERKGGKHGSKGFKAYLQKSRLAYSILPSTKFYMQTRSGSSSNQLMRNRILADYGLNLGDGSPHSSRYGLSR